MASSVNERKVREGLQLMKEAEKSLQTSWLKWKPDYDNAADKYMKAGTSFKVGKSYDQAKDAFLKSAEAHLKNNSLYHSAKALEQAGMMLKEMKQIVEAAELLKRAGDQFQQNGTPDTAAMVVIKAAKMCEGTNPTKAVELYEKAAELRVMDDKLREAAEPYNKATQLLIKQQKFEDVVNSMNKQLELYGRIGNTAMQYKIILGLVVVYLHQGDYVAADKCFKNSFEVSGFGNSDEGEAIENLLDAYDQSDSETMATIVTKPLFRHLDNELSKLAKDLKPSEEFNISCKATELRVISDDIVKLKLDHNKPMRGEVLSRKNAGAREENLAAEDEDNPLGSEEKTGTDVAESDKDPLETGVSSKSSEDDTANDETIADQTTTASDTTREPSDNEDEDLEEEGGLC